MSQLESRDVSPAEKWAVYIDGGTTHTRAWLCRDEVVVASARAAVGARDTARDGHNGRMCEAVRGILAELGEAALGARIVAAGMITSPQGLVEIPHVAAPAGARELGAGARLVAIPAVGPRPILFVPGVKVGAPRLAPAQISAADIMRGEEVLALGLHALGRLQTDGVLLNLGSHWKAIRLDTEGRIAGSVSTLAGELVHAVSTQTILASSLPGERPDALAPELVAAGAAVSAAQGLPRALYCVRLLEQRSDTTAADRYAFLLGAVMAADEAALIGDARGPILIAGAPALGRAWAARLAARGLVAGLLDESAIEAAFRAGAAAVANAHPADTVGAAAGATGAGAP